MASCYICGRPGSDFRRTVYTGSSYGSYWSNRSHGSSSRRYYGVRTVCESCAANIDKGNTIKTIIFLIISVGVLLYFIIPKSTPEPLSNDTYNLTGRIKSYSGLNIRSAANSSSVVLGSIPYNEAVTIIDKNGPSETIAGQTANWIKVKYNGAEGWVWGGFVDQ